MPTLNVRNFPEQWHKKLRHLAAESGQSVAAEVRALLIVALGGQKSVTGAPAKATVEPPAHQEAAPRPAPMKAPSSQPLAKARSKYGYNTGNESIDEYLEGENNEEMRKRIMTEHLYGGDVPEESRHNLWSRFCAAERKRSASTAAKDRDPNDGPDWCEELAACKKAEAEGQNPEDIDALFATEG